MKSKLVYALQCFLFGGGGGEYKRGAGDLHVNLTFHIAFIPWPVIPPPKHMYTHTQTHKPLFINHLQPGTLGFKSWLPADH